MRYASHALHVLCVMLCYIIRYIRYCRYNNLYLYVLWRARTAVFCCWYCCVICLLPRASDSCAFSRNTARPRYSISLRKLSGYRKASVQARQTNTNTTTNTNTNAITNTIWYSFLHWKHKTNLPAWGFQAHVSHHIVRDGIFNILKATMENSWE